MAHKDPHSKSLDKLLARVEELSPMEVELVFRRLLNIRAKNMAPALGEVESALLQEINSGFSDEDQKEFEILLEKRDMEALTDAEYERMIMLTNEMERLNVRRMELIAQLSTLRNVSVRELMQQLNIMAA